MKKIIILLFSISTSSAVLGQVDKASSNTRPVMTVAFADSLEKSIMSVMPNNYTIKLSYVSTTSSEGKLLKPLITREYADGTIEDNDFVQKMRVLIQNAPAWEPAFDTSQNKPIEGTAIFDVFIKKGKISITETKQ